MRNDGTWNDQDLQAHIESILRDQILIHERHKEQLERLIFKTQELMDTQSAFFSGDRTKLGLCKKLEKELWDKTQYLLKIGYNIDRFKKPDPTQVKLL